MTHHDATVGGPLRTVEHDADTSSTNRREVVAHARGELPPVRFEKVLGLVSDLADGQGLLLRTFGVQGLARLASVSRRTFRVAQPLLPRSPFVPAPQAGAMPNSDKLLQAELEAKPPARCAPTDREALEAEAAARRKGAQKVLGEWSGVLSSKGGEAGLGRPVSLMLALPDYRVSIDAQGRFVVGQGLAEMHASGDERQQALVRKVVGLYVWRPSCVETVLTRLAAGQPPLPASQVAMTSATPGEPVPQSLLPAAGELDHPHAERRLLAQKQLARWMYDFSLVGGSMIAGTAVALLAPLERYQVKLDADLQPVIGEGLVQMTLSPYSDLRTAARTIVALYVPSDRVDAVLGALTVASRETQAGGDTRLEVHVQCRDWLTVQDDALRERLADHVFDELYELSMHAEDPAPLARQAVARFLKAHPQRDEAAFQQGLVTFMSLGGPGCAILRRDDFRSDLTTDEPGAPALPAALVHSAQQHARANVARRQQRTDDPEAARARASTPGGLGPR